MANEVMFNEKTARRIAKVVRASELEGGGSDRQSRGSHLQRPSKLVKITTAVTAFGSAGTGVYGQGVGNLLVLSANATGGVTEKDSGVSVKVYSRDTLGTAVNRVVQVKVIDEFFVIDVDYCA